MFILLCPCEVWDSVITYAASITASSSPALPSITGFHGGNLQWLRQARLWGGDETAGWPQAFPQAFVCHAVSLKHMGTSVGDEMIYLSVSELHGRMKWIWLENGLGWGCLWIKTFPPDLCWKSDTEHKTVWLIMGAKSNHVTLREESHAIDTIPLYFFLYLQNTNFCLSFIPLHLYTNDEIFYQNTRAWHFLIFIVVCKFFSFLSLIQLYISWAIIIELNF